ncbi:T9SS type A sorting domain-containing protein [uncultured Lutibacter sp.]|uniref:T9SS type A sorting domain-containing protein n=1 Tax=uncultured Lutibacter sp. TaxID=437739 RepID=UPI00261AFAA1|nr:T9SS type A sorting domain-containing protein [uncultured Lutibacter sp.]
MKKSLTLLVLICCFSATTYSLNHNLDLNLIEYSKITYLGNNEFDKTSDSDDLRPKYRIGFNAPQIDHRQLLLTIDRNTTDGVDWGYDAQLYQLLNDDMFWVIDSKKYVIQATDSIFNGKEIPLGITTTQGGLITIGIDALENPIEGVKVYLKDKELNLIYNIEEADYQITLPAGEYLNRYVITFVSAETILNDDVIVVDVDAADNDESNNSPFDFNLMNNNSNNASIKDQVLMYVANGSNTLNIKNNQLVKINNLVLYNRLGQVAQMWDRNLNLEKVSLLLNVKEGIYIIQATTEIGNISKRIVIRNI